VLHGHEAAPIVANNTMYIVTPYPNLVYALDLSKDGAPVKWKYEPKTLAAAQGVACCDVVNRGVSYADATIFLNTLDNRTIALDADTGKEKWVSRLGDPQQRRDDHDGAPRREGQSPRGQLWWRDGGPWLADGARCQERKYRVARVFDRP
jgi:outer membrane protein assembly factor BamB